MNPDNQCPYCSDVRGHHTADCHVTTTAKEIFMTPTAGQQDDGTMRVTTIYGTASHGGTMNTDVDGMKQRLDAALARIVTLESDVRALEGAAVDAKHTLEWTKGSEPDWEKGSIALLDAALSRPSVKAKLEGT